MLTKSTPILYMLHKGSNGKQHKVSNQLQIHKINIKIQKPTHVNGFVKTIGNLEIRKFSYS